MAESDQDITPDGSITAETVEEPASWGGQSAAPDRDELPAGTRVGRLTIRHRLGAGGMGVVYAASDPKLDRNVALKFLRPKSRTSVEYEKAHARMLREARAMAQISHPNVITVYDVGTFDDDVYVAMEMVDGQSLAEWLEQEPRTWSEILQVYQAAGRGLAAAHAAGLIHRDFKPDNVLVANDGSVKVTDFGLVGLSGSTDSAAATPSRQPADMALTETNAVMGTPRYMAPEQYDAGPTSAATDQFNFCVALYESLAGVNPFAGSNLPARYRAIVAGKIEPVAGDRQVPGWLLPIIRRGLAVAPAERHDSMDALLSALARDPVARRRKLVGIAAAVVVAAGGGAAGYWAVAGGKTQAAAMCKGAAARLDGVWDDQVKQAAQQAFRGSGAPFANTTWKNVRNRLDAYASAWTAMHTEACERTRVYKDQSGAVLELRMACLDARRAELKTLTELLGSADKTTARHALRAAYALAPVASCADIASLKAGAVSVNKEHEQTVRQVRTMLARAAAMTAAGKYAEALAASRDALARATQTKLRGLQAEAGYRLGLALDRAGKPGDASKTLKQALWNAEASRMDSLAVSIWIARLHVAAKGGGASPVTESFVERASAALARRNNDPAQAAQMTAALGGLRLKQGRFRDAHSLFQRALAGWRKLAHSAHDPAIPHALNNLALAEVELGKYEAAERHYNEALQLYRRRLGKDHPRLADVMGNLGLLLATTGRPRKALERDSIGNALTRLGKLGDGLRQLQIALRLREKLAGENHPDVASTLHAIAIVLRKAGKLDHALGANLRAVKIMKQTYGRLDAAWTHMVIGLAETRMLRKECTRAVALLGAVLPVERKRRGDTAPEVRRVHLLLAICHEQQKHTAETIRHYEAALAIDVPSQASRGESARMQFMLARALHKRSAEGDRDRAKKLAQQAHRYFVASGQQRLAADIKAWLASH